jgi:hypothetical protein
MKQKSAYFLLAAFLGFGYSAIAQYESYVHTGEIGITAGAASYFGDLNTTGNVTHSKLALGAFYKRQFGDYVAVRLGGQYARVGYSDVYSKNEYYHTRNLSFNSDIWEATLQGDFNFFRFNPIDPDYRFTPYLTFGAGAFHFNPYAYLNGQKYYLQPLHTEGQDSPEYPGRKPYKLVAACFPVGMGFKWALNEDFNLGIEFLYRFTTTDYLDDVSTTYAGPAAFPNLPDGKPSPAFLLQDRSYVYGTPIGIAGRQRGYSGQKDSYATASITLSFNLSTYRCPSARL